MATPTLAQARSHYDRQRRITLAALTAVRRLFKQFPKPSIPQIAAVAGGYQLASATLAGQTTAGFADSSQPLTVASQFMGISSHGFSMIEPIIATIDRVVPAPVEPLPDAWWDDAAVFMADLERLIVSEVADAGRSASQVEFVARPDWTNYVRMLNPPSCARCTILAGRIYRDLEAFQRHPMCFPAGTIVSGPGARGATRRWYEGELVVIRTAGGKEVSATANHPVLTDQGWVPASLLAEGGYVVSRASGDRSRALVVPDHDQMPARIEDLWSADGMSPLGRMPVSAEDFHGDGLGSSHVDVVLADGPLRDRKKVAFLKHLREQNFTVRPELSLALSADRARLELDLAHALPAPSDMRRGYLIHSALFGQFAGPQVARLAATSNLNIGLKQATPDHGARKVQAHRERVLALAGQVGGHHRIGIDAEASPARWDAPAGEFSGQNRAGYADRGMDLRERLAGQVELDRIVELRRVGFAGHVYNLTSSEGWYDANGLIVSNCDCVMIPVTTWQDAHDNGLISSPQDAFDKGQVRGLSEADTQAVTDGADLIAVVNAHRGMTAPTLFGRKVKATTAGTTKRAAWRKANPSRLVRLRPESIYESAKDRVDAIRLLKLYGYIR